jgi:hypothetical protein
LNPWRREEKLRYPLGKKTPSFYTSSPSDRCSVFQAVAVVIARKKKMVDMPQKKAN